MARLKEIRVGETPLTYSNQRGWFFHPSAHHVRQLLMHFLPADFVLDGSSLLCVLFGNKPDEEPQSQQMLGSTIYYVEPFDIGAYMASSPSARQENMLRQLTAVLVHLADRAGADPAVIENAASHLRACGFSLQIPVRKLWRVSPDKKLRIEVYRCLGSLIGEAWEAHVFDSARTLLAVEPITSRPAYLDRTTHFSKSRWEGELFQIIQAGSNVVAYQLDTGNYKSWPAEDGR